MADATKRSPAIGAATLRAIGTLTRSDPRTVLRVLRGEPITNVARIRVREELLKAGLGYLLPEAQAEGSK
jgi:hypothetical protein